MDFSAIKDLYIGSTPVQSAWLNGSKVWGRKPAVDEQSIRDAMILWYDLKKQGATNESMASTPELVNHAYDPDKANVIDWTQFSTRGDGVQQFSIEITSTTNYWVVNQAAYHRTNSIPSFYVKVANLPEGHTINYFYGDGSDERQTYVVSYNGIHKIPACRVSPNVTTATGWFIDPNNPTGQTVADLVGTTITQVNPTFNATCYNFAWSGMSGVGGYTQNYRDESRWIILPNRISFTKTETTINVTKVLESAISAYYVTKDNDTSFIVKSYKIKVSGMTDGQTITYTNNNRTVIYEIKSNGEHILPQIDLESGGNHCGFIFNKVQESCNITIEQLPLYPNSLVSDGVDDYCLVEGLPLLNKEDGYTVIAKRKRLSNMGCLASKRNTALTNGAFVFELSVDGEDKRCDSFDGRNQISSFADTISWQTKNSYNGKPIGVGDEEDNDVLRLFLLYDKYYCQVALYSFLLFNRDLTTEEIEWVKTNLIETEQ